MITEICFFHADWSITLHVLWWSYVKTSENNDFNFFLLPSIPFPWGQFLISPSCSHWKSKVAFFLPHIRGEQSAFKCLAQGRFDIWTGGDRDQNTNPTINGWPTLLPQLGHHVAQVCLSFPLLTRASPASFLCLTLLPPLSLLFCSRSTSSISYTLISKVSVVDVAPRRFGGAWGPSGPSTQHAPGLEEEEEEEVMVCLEERWEGEEEEESKVSAGIRRRRWRPERTNKMKKTHHQSLSHLVLNTVALKLSYSFIKYPHFSNLILTIPYQYMLNNYTKEVFSLIFLHCNELCILSNLQEFFMV